MSETIAALAAAWLATSTLECVSVLFGLAYVLLAAKESAWCWPAAIVNTGTAIALFWDATLLMESALNVFYLLIAFYGLWQWNYGGNNKSALSISRWSKRNHAAAGVTIVCLTLVSGNLLQQHSNAYMPYLDSFTTWSAVIATWMVTRKILENWLYWIIIDAVSIYLFWSKGLLLYSALFAVYFFVAIYGYQQWLANSTKNNRKKGHEQSRFAAGSPTKV